MNKKRNEMYVEMNGLKKIVRCWMFGCVFKWSEVVKNVLFVDFK